MKKEREMDRIRRALQRLLAGVDRLGWLPPLLARLVV